MKLKLTSDQLFIVTVFGAGIIIQWGIQLIAPFYALTRINELNNLAILSDPSLQSSHELFRLLAIGVDYGFTLNAIVRMIQPWLRLETVLVWSILGLILKHPSEVFKSYQKMFGFLIFSYFVILGMILSSFSFAFTAFSPQRVVMLINRAGWIGMLGGIGLSFASLLWLSLTFGSLVRQKSIDLV